MKLLHEGTKKNIVCPKCGEDEFKDVEFRETQYTTYQIWCAKKDCKTDVLIPSKLVARKLIVKV